MLDILNRVGPPQVTGLREDRTKQDVFGAKTDFQDHLKQQMSKSGKKENDRPETDRFKTKIQADSSGGIKKKMMRPESEHKDDQVQEEDLNENTKEKKAKVDTDNLNFDPNMVLMLMASNENDFKTADSEESLQPVENKIENSELLSEVSTVKPSSAQVSMQDSVSQTVKEAVEDSAQSPVQELATPIDAELSVYKESVNEKSNTSFEKTSNTEVTAPALESLSVLPMDEQADKSDFQSRVMQALQQENASTLAEKPLSFKEEAMNLKVEAKSSQLGELAGAAQGTAQSTQTTAQESSADKNFSQSDSRDAKGDSNKKTFDTSLESHHVGVGQSFSTGFERMNANQGVAVGMTAQTSQRAEEIQAVKDIMNQANFLVTQGGGEVTLKLDSLNGVGDVQLKVMMENGKINVELNTQDRTVKKLIEDSLSDLKSSLASHQMSLEHVKINNVVASVNTENQSQHLQQDQSDSSNQFGQLEQQMQQQSQKQRSFEAARQWNSTTGLGQQLNFEKPVEMPLQNLRQSAASRYYGLNKGNSLNAVG